MKTNSTNVLPINRWQRPIFARLRTLRTLLIVIWSMLYFSAPPSRAQEPVAENLHLPLVMHAGSPVLATQPSWSAPLALTPDGAELWVVNPDANTVTIVDTLRLTKLDELAVGQEPWSIAVAPDGQLVYVLNRGSGDLAVIDRATRRLQARLPVGPEPGGLVLSPQRPRAYITLQAAHALAVIDTAHLTITAQIPLAAMPYALALAGDGAADGGEQLYVTHLLALPRAGGAEATDDGRIGQVTALDAESLQVRAESTLQPDVHGFPNLLSGIAIAQGRAWLPHVRAAPALPNRLTTTVFAAVAAVDLAANREDSAALLALNDEEVFGSPVNNPVAAIPAPDGQTLYVVLAGSNLVEVIDVRNPLVPRLLKFLPTGSNPRGLALSADGRRGYVMNFLSRSLSVLDLVNLKVEQEITVTGETLAEDVLRGKRLFHNATDPRLSRGSWLSCASCHPDGGSDGVTWFFPDGPRQTPPLWSAANTLPWHWSAALDEPQDVEETIHVIQHGLGLAPGADPPLLGAPNAGRSADLDALAAFMLHGIRSPVAPPPAPTVAEGRRLFVAAGCATCHGGPHWTISALPGAPGSLDPDGNGMIDEVLREVGTLNPQDIRGATGFDVPTLLGVGLSAPYLHDGSQPTLEALLASGHPDPHGAGNGLSQAEIGVVSSFLRSIDASTTPHGAQP
jgi:YVTN family beta-propeller protein